MITHSGGSSYWDEWMEVYLAIQRQVKPITKKSEKGKQVKGKDGN